MPTKLASQNELNIKNIQLSGKIYENYVNVAWGFLHEDW